MALRCQDPQFRGGEIAFLYTIDWVAKGLNRTETTQALKDITPVVMKVFCRSHKKFEIEGVNPSLIITGSPISSASNPAASASSVSFAS